MIVNTKGEMIFAILLLAGMIILCLFPSVMAVFGVIRALTIDDRTIRSFRTYIKTYKENYIRSISGGTLFIIIAITCSFYYFFLNLQANIIIQYMTYALTVYYLMMIMHYFSSNVHIETTFIQSIKNAALFTIKNPILSFLCSFMVLFTIFISVKIPILFLLITTPIIAYMSFQIFYKRSIRGMTAQT